MKKMPGDIIIVYMCTKNYDQMMYGSWDIVCNRWMDRLMAGWMDEQIEVTCRGGCPLNVFHSHPYCQIRSQRQPPYV